MYCSTVCLTCIDFLSSRGLPVPNCCTVNFENGCTGQSLVQSGPCTHFFGPRNSSLEPAGRGSLIFATNRFNHSTQVLVAVHCTLYCTRVDCMAESNPRSYRLNVRCGTCIAHRWKPGGLRIPMMYGTNSTDENFLRRSLRTANIQFTVLYLQRRRS